MKHPMGHFITPLYGEAKHPKGSPKTVASFYSVWDKNPNHNFAYMKLAQGF